MTSRYRHSARMMAARSPAKPSVLRVSLLAACLVGCTQSETPLSSREEGFVDYYLLGQWREYEPSGGGFDAGSLAYSVSLDDSGDLRVVQFDDDGTVDRVHAVYSTRLDGRKYANVRVVDCPGCTAEEQARLAADNCPFMIVQYSTFLPESVATADYDGDDRSLVDALAQQASASRGQFLFMVLMDSDFIEDAISSEIVSGAADCDTCLSEGPCLSTRGEELTRFLKGHDRDVFSPDSWSVLIRDRSN